MRAKWGLAFGLGVLMCVQSAHGQPGEREQILHLAAAPVLESHLRFADVAVIGEARTDIEVTARFVATRGTSGDTDPVERMKVISDRTGRVLRLEINAPGDPALETPGRASFAASIEIRLPVGTDLNLTNQFGAIQVAGIDGHVTITAQSAQVSANDLAGTLEVESSYGTVVIESAAVATVRGSGSSIGLTRVGSAKVEMQFGDVTATDIRGDLTIAGPNDQVIVNGVGGDLRIDGGHGAVTIHAPRGGLWVRTGAGVDVRDVGQIPPGTRWWIQGGFDPVVLRLPSTMNAEIRAASHFGPIESPFEVERKQGWNEEAAIRIGADERPTRIEIESRNRIQILREGDLR